jgi:hypothetical protein
LAGAGSPEEQGILGLNKTRSVALISRIQEARRRGLVAVHR